MQGGQRTGFALDGTKQLGSKNLLGFGGKFDFLRPVYSQPSASASPFALGGISSAGPQGYNLPDFLPEQRRRARSVPTSAATCSDSSRATGTPFRGYALGTRTIRPRGLNNGPGAAGRAPAAVLRQVDQHAPSELHVLRQGHVLADGSPQDRPRAAAQRRELEDADMRHQLVQPDVANRRDPERRLSLRLLTRHAHAACCSRASRRRSKRRTTTRCASATGVPCSSPDRVGRRTGLALHI